MRRIWFAGVLIVTTAALAVAWTPMPKLPETVEVVCVVDDDGLVSMVSPNPFKPSEVGLNATMSNLKSAVNLAGRSTGRADVIEASSSIQLIDNPMPLDRKPVPRRNPNQGDGCYTVCSCAKPIYCSTTGDVIADPGTEAVRKAPSPPGGNLCGCGPGCGTCELCHVVCR